MANTDFGYLNDRPDRDQMLPQVWCWEQGDFYILGSPGTYMVFQGMTSKLVNGFEATDFKGLVNTLGRDISRLDPHDATVQFVNSFIRFLNGEAV
jgi:hypothetical protein